MTSQWLLFICSLALPLSTLPISGMAAMRDLETRDPLRGGCVIDRCFRDCSCPFDQWQDARLLKFGYGMTADRKAAAYWYRRAAERGDARATFNIGFMLIHGIGADADPAEGLRLIDIAATASVQEAWFELGNLRRLGVHVTRDPHAAIDAYRRAAERGHVRAQHALGNMYGNGQGVGVDLVTAWKWWRLAARKGHELAAHAQRLATSMMTSAEISLARRAAETWLNDKKKP